MAITGVMRPGHCQLRVLDIEAAIRFYTQVMGLQPMGRDASGRAYFKCLDERDHHSLVLREADRAGMDFYGFKVRDAATLDRLEADLRAWGVATERVPAGELLETGERVRFRIPTGHTFELYAHKTDVGNGLGYVNPEAILDPRPGISPIRLDHWQIHGSDLDGSRDLFTEVLGFSLVERILMEDGRTDMAVWLSCSNKAHDIAFDSSGNRFETFCGGYEWYPNMQPTVWTWEEIGRAVFYHTRELNERFLTVVT